MIRSRILTHKTRQGRKVVATRYSAHLGNLASEVWDTQEKAETALAARLDRVASYESRPSIVKLPIGYLVVSYRADWDAWTYGTLGVPGLSDRLDLVQGYATREEAERHGRRHAAQALWPNLEDDGAPVLVDERERREFNAWVRWQRAYKAAREAGMSDHEAHQAACLRS